MTDRRAHAGLSLLIAAVVVWVVGHELTLTLGHPAPGAEDPLVATRHGVTWLLVAGMAAAIGAVGLALAARRLRRLHKALAGAALILPPPVLPSPGAVALQVTAIGGAALAAFAVQENLEHLLLHAHLPGLAVLVDGQYAAAVPVHALLAVVAGLVTATLRRRIGELAAAVARRPLDRPLRRDRARHLTVADLRLFARRLVGPPTGRAPPVLSS